MAGGLARDLRFGLRMLASRPGFTAVALLTLALGIGANTAVFSIVRGVLLRPLPYERPEELALLWTSSARGTFLRGDSTGGDFRAWRERSRSFEALAAFSATRVTLTGEGEPLRLPAAFVTHDLFALLGVEASLGRTFLPGEAKLGSHRVAVVSDGFWRRHLGARADAVGRTLVLGRGTYAIVGVMPRGFRSPSPGAELWLPLPEDHPIWEKAGEHFLVGLGRLKRGVGLPAARQELDALAAGLRREHPDSHRDRAFFAEPLHDSVVGGVRRSLWILLGAVGLVLSIACANVANLVLNRNLERRREMAIRAALGAGRLRLFRQLTVEGLLLSCLGGAGGLLLAYWGLDTLLALSGGSLPRQQDVRVDAGVLAFTALVSLVTGVLFGLAPALQAFRRDLHASLKEEGRVAGSARAARFRALLVVAEVGLSLVLLIAAGLLMSSFVRLARVDPGFRPGNLLTMRVSLPASRYEGNAQQIAFARRALESLAALPGVQAAGLVSHRPIDGDFWRYGIDLDGRTTPDGADRPSAAYRLVSPGYFRAMGIPLLRGRAFRDGDDAGAPRALVINETMARRFWPGRDPLGREVSFSFCRDEPCRVVGVVGDVKHFGPAGQEDPAMYGCFWQKPESYMNTWFFTLRTAAEPGAVVAAAKGRIWELDPALPLESVASMEERLAASIAPERFLFLLLGAFALVALGLAALGVYGTVSYSVSRRAHELGVRVALGARRGDLLRLVLRQGLVLTAAGLTLGLAGALAATRLLQGMLFGVRVTDPLTFAAVPLVLLGVSAVACYVPARRATRVDPVVALRSE